MASQSFVKDLNNAILVTSENHPEIDLSNSILVALIQYFENMKEGMNEEECIDKFLCCFSRTSKQDGKPVRAKLKSHYVNNNEVVPFELLAVLYNHAIQELAGPRVKNDRNYAVSAFNYKNLLESYLDYNSYHIIEDLMKFTQPLIESYVEKINSKQAKTIQNTTVKLTDANYNISNKIATNLGKGFLLNSFHGSILNGKIKASTDIGYTSNSKTQQDAILCIEKDGCSVNIICDGTGGGYRSEIASSYTTEEIGRWFNSLDLSKYKKININNKQEIIKSYKELSDKLNDKVYEINDRIVQKYPNSATTLVMAMVFPSFTIISNAGDSTAYAYDLKDNELHLLSKIESPTGHLDYEAARNDPDNNLVYNIVGSNRFDGVKSKLLFNTSTKKILLSSDGVTDLISFRNFKRLMSSRAAVASDFVQKAKYAPDVENIRKKMDNISAITIDINGFTKEGRSI